jgi:hypothetical protein
MPGSVLSDVRTRIADTEATLNAMENLLHAVLREIREEGDTKLVFVTDRNGERTEKLRTHPAMKRQKALVASIKSLKEYLKTLRAEFVREQAKASTTDMLSNLNDFLKQETETHQ